MSYTVGLGDSPQRIAHRLTGDPRRYQELLASNPHKSIVYVGGAPTFTSLGVGEQLALPDGFLGAVSLNLPNVSASSVRSSLPPNLQAEWDKHVGEYNSSAAAQAGAQSALDLASGNMSNDKIVHAFAGAVAPVPGVGPVMAGLTEFFYKYGPAIGDAFGQLFGLVHCNKDDRTPQAWLSATKIKPESNSFASVVVPMLALAFSDYVACREGAHGIGWKPCSQIIPAAVNAWNAIATGNEIDYFVPAINSSDCKFVSMFAGGFHTDYGFILNPAQSPYAFVPLSKVPSSMLGGEGSWWMRVKAKSGPIAAKKAPPAPAPATPAPKRVVGFKVPPAAAAPPAPAAPALPPGITPADFEAVKAALAAAAAKGQLVPAPPAAPPPAAAPPVLAPVPPTPAPAPPAATPGAYGPYPSRGALGAPLDAPPPHPHGHHGGGGGGHHGGGHPGHRPGFRGGRSWWGGDWYGPWLYEPVTTTATCTTWGDPVEMSPAMESVGQVQLRNSGGRPATVRGADGVLYLFSVEGGVMTARPCAAMTSTLGDAPGATLYLLYRRAGSSSSWMPVGDWMSMDDAQQQMTAILTSAPTAQLGAYAWDGRNLTWKFF